MTDCLQVFTEGLTRHGMVSNQHPVSVLLDTVSTCPRFSSRGTVLTLHFTRLVSFINLLVLSSY